MSLFFAAGNGKQDDGLLLRPYVAADSGLEEDEFTRPQINRACPG